MGVLANLTPEEMHFTFPNLGLTFTVFLSVLPGIPQTQNSAEIAQGLLYEFTKEGNSELKHFSHTFA